MRLFAATLAAGVAIAAASAQAQTAADYPNRPVRIIVNVTPGGGVDIATRLVAQADLRVERRRYRPAFDCRILHVVDRDENDACSLQGNRARAHRPGGRARGMLHECGPRLERTI